MADDAMHLVETRTLIQSGVVAGDKGQPTWNLYDGGGPRSTVIHVPFAERYRRPPAVSIALSSIDIIHTANARLTVTAQNVTEDGFEAVFATWSDSQIWSARAAWIAHN